MKDIIVNVFAVVGVFCNYYYHWNVLIDYYRGHPSALYLLSVNMGVGIDWQV